MTRRNFLLITAGYLLIILGLFFYSYTQVDLNLTLSQITIWRKIETDFQYIGWFQRPLSTAIYLIIIFLLSAFYFLLLFLAKKNKINEKQVWWLIGIMSVVLLFSYNGFSYDLFNYMFDARIVAQHRENPYFHKALDYPKDPWINFMRWTHRTYPYGPVWLGLTVPLSFLGMGFFLPTLFLFKTLMISSYLGAVYFIRKIMEIINPLKKILVMSLFAFNPLIIVESLVSAHHDIVMIFFAVAGFYFLLKKKYWWSILLLLLSIGIKFATVFILPAFILTSLRGASETSDAAISSSKNKDCFGILFLAMTSMIIAVILASWRIEFQPWYLIWILPFAFLTNKRWITIPFIIFSVGVLLQYAPYLYSGNWDYPIPLFKNWIIEIALAVAVTAFFVLKLLKEKLRLSL